MPNDTDLNGNPRSVGRFKKILIVDDDPDVLGTFFLAFTEEEKKNIDFVGTSKEAISSLRKKKYDKIICDLRLDGEIDGFQILREARENGVKIRVLLTAVSSEIPIDGTPATYAFRKPCNPDCIRQWVLTEKNDTKRVLTPTI